MINDFLAIITFISIFGIIMSTVRSLGEYGVFFTYIEYITVVIFIFEYIGRIIGSKNKLKYIFSFFGFVDLIAILPTILGLSNFTFLKSLRLFRVLRFLRMLRVIKLLRIDKKDLTVHDRRKIQNEIFRTTLEIYLIMLISAILISATLMWFFEGHYNDSFSDIPMSMIWSSKVLLGGIVNVHPQTFYGDIVIIVTRFVGLVLFGLLIAVIDSFIKKIFFENNNIKK